MQHILSKVKEKDIKRRVENHLKKYLLIQIQMLIPKDNGVDPVAAPSQRLLNLQKLLHMIDDLPNQVSWKQKEIKDEKLKEKKK